MAKRAAVAEHLHQEEFAEGENGGRQVYTGSSANARPYQVDVVLKGTTTLLLHGYNVDAVEAKGKEAKGSRSKKTDDVESFVTRDQAGHICVPMTYLHACIRDTGKFKQDPRSPRKSMFDLLKAAVGVLPELLVLRNADGKLCKDWDMIDKRRACVMRAAVNRCRPAFLPGWTVEATLDVLLPEYLSEQTLHELLTDAGRVTGLADYRPLFGRFALESFKRRK